jgi:hypothetical protein
MAMKHTIYMTAFALIISALSMTSCSKDEDSFVLRSDSELHFSYASGVKDFTVCTTGDWSVTTSSPWLSFNVTEGTGDGVSRQSIQVISARNTGEARRDSFILHAAGKDLTVVCLQDEGAPLTFGKGKLSGSMQVAKASQLSLELPYSYGYKGMQLNLHATFSGAGAHGLSINDTTLVLDAEKGTLVLPVVGTPTSAGPVVIKVAADDNSVTPAIMQASVLSRVLLEQHFDLMIWGGELINYLPGVMGGFMTGDGGKVIDPSIEVAECKATTDGSNDLVLTMAESYRQLRGFSGWDGARIYEHPGYVKIGTASLIGKIVTPALSDLSDGITSVKVTCRVAQYISESKGSLTIKAVNGGTPSIDKYTYQYAGTKTGCTWEDISFTVSGVNKKTKIEFSTEGNMRFCIDDVIISEGM